MGKISVASFHVAKRDIIVLRDRLIAMLHSAGIEPFTGKLKWRINDTLGDDSKVTIVAYNTGSVVVSGHGTKFDLTTSFVKTYDVDRAKK